MHSERFICLNAIVKQLGNEKKNNWQIIPTNLKSFLTIGLYAPTTGLRKCKKTAFSSFFVRRKKLNVYWKISLLTK